MKVRDGYTDQVEQGRALFKKGKRKKVKKNGMKKVWVPVIALCSAGLLAGTGFAAWTIALNQSGEASGNRKADSVTDNHLVVQNVKWYQGGTIVEGNPTVCFGYPETKAEGVSGTWLTNTNRSGTDTSLKENRSFSLHFDVEKGTSIKDYNLTVTRTVTDKDNAFADCVKGNLIVAPGTNTTEKPLEYTLSPDAVTTEKGSNVTSHTCDVSFKWGTHFGKTLDTTSNTNPLNFYNRYDSDSWTTEYGNEAGYEAGYDASRYQDFSNNMGKVAKLNDGPTFKITIQATQQKA